ncbi:membrane protein implicated in regulation of membrane protease activity [Lipingzhangella halophila]|uniref:Membrane protein implicated in regulation of membrane protease activity n=1 Tax=Lipingzhangella halophila TaxID=1783352 RepID=A0A7W7RKR9_9ACTN|nr:NfeD family protein [Lipingzhangella halophila]MBB4933326.1 membrane protein implicated in regulation of membrane protease activity [Lipingzhangella halophila]
MPMWIIWLILAAALGVAEVLTMTLSLGLVAIGALAAGIVGAMGLGLIVQVPVFVVTTAAGLLIVRPIAMKHIRQPPPLQSGAGGLVGQSAVVTHEVTGEAGRIKLSGEEWSARSLDEDMAIPAGTRVDVTEIDGATAVVYPREPLP